MDFEGNVNVNYQGSEYTSNPVQIVYDAIRKILIVLHEVLQDTINGFGSFVNDTVVWLTLPSGMSFKIAELIGQNWTVPDFVPAEKTFSEVKLKLPGCQFTWPIVWNFQFMFDVVMPKLMNFKVSDDLNVYWYNWTTHTRTQGKNMSPNKYPMLSDVSLDAFVIGLIVAISIALAHIGAESTSEKFVSKAINTTSNITKVYGSIQQMTKLVSIANSAVTTEENLTDINTSLGPSGTIGAAINNLTTPTYDESGNPLNILAKVSSIFANLTSFINELTKEDGVIDDILNAIDNDSIKASEIINKLDQLKAAIGLRLMFH